MTNNDSAFDFSYDDSDLEVAIAQQTQAAVQKGEKKKTTGSENFQGKSNENISSEGFEGSTQEKLDGGNDLEKFFDSIERQTKENPDEKNYLNEEEGEEENTEQSEEETEKSEESTEDDNDDTVQEGTMDGNVLLDILRQEQLLYIPEDFEGELDAQTLDKFKQQTLDIQRQDLITAMRNQYSNNPELLQEFDYFMMGGKNSNLPVYRNVTQQIKNYENLDINTDENQRLILEDYLREGLDPNNTAHRFRLGKVKEDVNEIINGLEGESRSKEAREYFVDKFNKIKQGEEQRVVQLKQREDQFNQQREYEAEVWHNEFQNILSKRTWNNQKKQAILEEQYSEVQMDDGSYAPVWYAKEAMIKSNPELYQVYLDWLNTNFDLNSGGFINTEQVDASTQVTRKILSMVNKKGEGKPKSGSQAIAPRRQLSNRQVTSDDLMY